MDADGWIHASSSIGGLSKFAITDNVQSATKLLCAGNPPGLKQNVHSLFRAQPADEQHVLAGGCARARIGNAGRSHHDAVRGDSHANEELLVEASQRNEAINELPCGAVDAAAHHHGYGLDA